MKLNTTITQSELDGDFEYNFGLTPFNYLLDGIHWLVTAPYHAIKRLIAAKSTRTQKYGFQGPVCLLK